MYVIDVAGLEEDAQDLIFARVVTKLREHLEKRDLGVQHVVVFVDELNKYAPGDGPETYVRKMLLDIAERGRYLGPRAVRRAAVPLAGAPPRRRQLGHGAVRPDGRRRAGDAGLRGAQSGDQDQARHVGEGTADGASSALHTTDLRALPAPRGHARPRRREPLSGGAGGRRSMPRCCARCARSIPRSRSAGCRTSRSSRRTTRSCARGTTSCARVRPTCAASSPRTSAPRSRRARPCRPTRRRRFPPPPRTIRTASDGPVRLTAGSPPARIRHRVAAIARRSCRARLRRADRARARPARRPRRPKASAPAPSARRRHAAHATRAAHRGHLDAHWRRAGRSR